jgi:hypothetical protein
MSAWQYSVYITGLREASFSLAKAGRFANSSRDNAPRFHFSEHFFL